MPPAERHDEASVRALEAHIQTECEQRSTAVLAAAAAQAAAIVTAARRRAVVLLRQVRRRERHLAQAVVDAERARGEAQFRRRCLAGRWAQAEQGVQQLEQALIACWKAAPAARIAWLRLAFSAAQRSLLAEQWLVEYPTDWRRTEAGDLLTELRAARPALHLEWKPRSALEAGYRIRAGRALIDATPAGLAARRARIAGRLLAELAASPAGPAV